MSSSEQKKLSKQILIIGLNVFLLSGLYICELKIV
jgi:hypothetical protein